MVIREHAARKAAEEAQTKAQVNASRVDQARAAKGGATEKGPRSAEDEESASNDEANRARIHAVSTLIHAVSTLIHAVSTPVSPLVDPMLTPF